MRKKIGETIDGAHLQTYRVGEADPFADPALRKELEAFYEEKTLGLLRTRARNYLTDREIDDAEEAADKVDEDSGLALIDKIIEKEADRKRLAKKKGGKRPRKRNKVSNLVLI